MRALRGPDLVRVAGVDEAGRGPLAGPVVAAAVILHPQRRIHGLADSKVLTPAERARLAPIIRARALAFGRRLGRPRRDRLPEYPQATLLAMRRALLRLPVPPTHIKVDGNRCPLLADLALRLHRSRPSSRAMRASPRSAPPPSSPRPTATP